MQFIDLKSQQARIREDIEARIQKVLDHGQYILGPEINELQDSLSNFSKTKYVLCCSSGTDALLLSLLGLGFRSQEGVIVPSFTFASSAEVIPMLGGIPIFADVAKNTYNLSPDSIIVGDPVTEINPVTEEQTTAGEGTSQTTQTTESSGGGTTTTETTTTTTTTDSSGETTSSTESSSSSGSDGSSSYGSSSYGGYYGY